jgi:hypothetical protein
MEGGVKTCRTMLAAVALAAVAGNASLAQHGGGKSAPGHGAAHHQSPRPGASEGAAVPAKIAPNAAGESDRSAGRSASPATVNGIANKTGGGEIGHNAGPQASGTAAKTGTAVQSIDLARSDDGYASLRRRAMRSTLIANAPKKIPTTVPPGNIVVHGPTSSPGEIARNAIGVTAAGSGIRNLTVAHPPSGIAVNGSVAKGNVDNANPANGNLANGNPANGTLANGMVAKTSIGGNAGEIRHENPHPVPVAGAIHSTGLNGSAMGHPAANAAALGGPAHMVTGIGGGSVRPKY